MSFFISDAMAQGAEGQQAPGLEMVFMLLAMFGIFYFLLIRPQQKKQKEHKAMIEALTRGDEVVTSGGIQGKITGVTDETLTVEIAKDVRVKVDKAAVARKKATG